LSLTLPRKDARERALIGLLAVLFVLPSAAWLVLDRQAWLWDPAWYGEVSVELYYHLTHNIHYWPRAMINAFGQKAPGIAWLGQLFVPLGRLLGSVDDGLLISILLTQALALAVTGLAIWHLTRRAPVAAAGMAAMASGPLFVGLSHQYFVEPLQMLAVAWFVLVAVRAPYWSRLRTLSHLLAAAAVAMLAKASSPLYAVGPGLLALVYAFRPGVETGSHEWRQPGVALPLLGGSLLAVAAVAWYVTNWSLVTWHVALSSSGSFAQLFGPTDTFANALHYWLAAARRSFLLPEVGIAAGVVFAGALVLRVVRAVRERAARRSMDILALVAVLQIMVALAVFATSPNRENRYLLPLAPYATLLVSWALVQFRWEGVTALCLAAFLYQGAAVHAQTLGLAPLRGNASPWLIPAQRDSRDDAMMKAVIERTCRVPEDAWRYNIVGVDLGWLNHNTLSYYAAIRQLEQGFDCLYTGLGFAQSDATVAWEKAVALRPRYVITAAPEYAPSAQDPYNRVSEAFLERALAGGYVVPEEPLDSEDRVLIFRWSGD